MEVKSFITLAPGNTNRKGMLNTVNLLIRVACFANKYIMFATSKAADLK
jgi:hypothetical protein